MKKIFLLIILALAVSPVAAQSKSSKPAVKSGAATPATCKPGSNGLFVVVSGGTGALKVCTATNTWSDAGGGGGANTALSNLASVAINDHLLPGTDSAVDIGSTTGPKRFRTLLLNNGSSTVIDVNSGTFKVAELGSGNVNFQVSSNDVMRLDGTPRIRAGSAHLTFGSDHTGLGQDVGFTWKASGVIRVTNGGSSGGSLLLASSATTSAAQLHVRTTDNTTRTSRFENSNGAVFIDIDAEDVGGSGVARAVFGGGNFKIWGSAGGQSLMHFMDDVNNPGVILTPKTGINADGGGSPPNVVWTINSSINSANNAVAAYQELIRTNSAGTPAAGFGARKAWQLESSTTDDQDAAQQAVVWTTATHASRSAAITYQVVDNAAALSEKFRIAGTGTTAPGVQLTQTGANGSQDIWGQVSESITLSTGGATTDSTIDLPANSIILAVNARITTTITGINSTALNVGDPTTSARFGTTATFTSGTTIVGTQALRGSVTTDAAGPTQTSTAKVRLTLSGGADNTPSAGAVRITIVYMQMIAPTS